MIQIDTIHTGDCLEWLKTLPDGCADMVFMDPPYGHNNNNGDLIHRREAALGHGEHGKARAISNDGPEANDLFRACLPDIARILKPGHCCCCCCCGGGGPDPQFARWSLWIDEVLDFKQMVVWDKGPMGMGWHYRRSYETVLVAQKRGAKCAWYDTSKKVENIIRPGHFGIRKIIPRADQHPTQKPVALAAWFISLHSQEGDVVLDPFSGHGSTLVAAARMGRHYLGCEIDPEYVAIANARIKAECDKTALFTTVEAPE